MGNHHPYLNGQELFSLFQILSTAARNGATGAPNMRANTELLHRRNLPRHTPRRRKAGIYSTNEGFTMALIIFYPDILRWIDMDWHGLIWIDMDWHGLIWICLREFDYSKPCCFFHSVYHSEGFLWDHPLALALVDCDFSMFLWCGTPKCHAKNHHETWRNQYRETSKKKSCCPFTVQFHGYHPCSDSSMTHLPAPILMALRSPVSNEMLGAAMAHGDQ